ncbi:alaS, partial [Symbiodinium sp. KB8]
EKGYQLDVEGFEKALKAQKDRSRAASEVSKDDWNVLLTDTEQEFIGYDSLEAQVKVVKYRKVTSKKEGDQYQLVFNLTPFYAEGGGQVGDKGYLEAPNGDVTYIVDTKRENNEIVLGSHVEQKGSAVHSKYLRFDFSHFSKLTVEELREVENFVNARIDGQLPLEENRNVPMKQAMEEGAMALFGEKYGDTVRTIRFGQSIELCGGTHVDNTADIWHFKIVSEGAVAAGIRRIEAITSDAVKEFYFNNNRMLFEIKDMLKNSQDPVKS